MVAGGATVAAHLVLIGLLTAVAPAREEPRPARVDFEMARLQPPPEAPEVVPLEPQAPAAAEASPAPAKLHELDEARAGERRRAVARISEEIEQRAILEALAAGDGEGEARLADKIGGGDLVRSIHDLSDGEAGGGAIAVGGGMRGTRAAGAGGDVRMGTGIGPGSVDAPAPRVDREAVRKAVQAKVRYPRQAEEMGVEGTVMVEFRIDEAGAPREVRIVRSADPSLDDAALEAVDLAAPFESPGGRVRVPVQFTLPAP